MLMFGVRVCSVSDARFDWFTTDADLEPGRYVLKTLGGRSDVFLSETIAGLIMLAGPRLQQAEDLGRESLASPGITETDRQRLEEEHTQGLLERLTETSSIWQAEPKWVRRLKPA